MRKEKEKRKVGLILERLMVGALAVGMMFGGVVLQAKAAPLSEQAWKSDGSNWAVGYLDDTAPSGISCDDATKTITLNSGSYFSIDIYGKGYTLYIKGNVAIAGKFTDSYGNVLSPYISIDNPTTLKMDPGSTLTCENLPEYAYKNIILPDGVSMTYAKKDGRYDDYTGTTSYFYKDVTFTSGGGGQSSAREGFEGYLDNKVDAIKDVESGSTIVIPREDGLTTLSNSIMHSLVEKGDVTLRFEFTYEGVDHVVIIPAGAAIDSDIGWYGPLFLLAHYGDAAGADSASAPGSAYTVQAGDSLSKIAASRGMKLADLLAKNPQIKNPNFIRVGQSINL